MFPLFTHLCLQNTRKPSVSCCSLPGLLCGTPRFPLLAVAWAPAFWVVFQPPFLRGQRLDIAPDREGHSVHLPQHGPDVSLSLQVTSPHLVAQVQLGIGVGVAGTQNLHGCLGQSPGGQGQLPPQSSKGAGDLGSLSFCP